MINFSDIENTIIKLDMEYTNTNDLHNQILYSKLALLEFGGWLEESFDDLLHEYLNKKVTSSYIHFCKDKVIKKNYGLHWDNNIRLMINNTIGTLNLEIIETTIESMIGGISILSSILNGLSPNRNSAAHTSTPVLFTRTYDTPSLTLGNFRRVKPILVEIEDLICNHI